MGERHGPMPAAANLDIASRGTVRYGGILDKPKPMRTTSDAGAVENAATGATESIYRLNSQVRVNFLDTAEPIAPSHHADVAPVDQWTHIAGP